MNALATADRVASPVPAGNEIDLVLRVAAKRALADAVVEVVLADPSRAPLPVWQPGAHVDLFVGEHVRQYSLCGDPTDRGAYTVAVLREPASRGGSQWVHDELAVGGHLRVRGPRNHFPLVDAAEYLFLAGGIGITPILPMVQEVARRGRPWRLAYGGRSRNGMAYRDRLERQPEVTIWPQDERGLLDLPRLLGAPRDGVAVYCCGPEPLLQAVEQACAGWPKGALHLERFAPKQQHIGEDTAFEVELARTGKVVAVPAGTSIVDALEAAGVPVETSCSEGTCGTCETAVLAGRPDHRDSLLSDDEREASETMMLCVSRSCSPRLVLDL